MSYRFSTRAIFAVFLATVIPGLAYAATLYQRTFDPKHGGSICYTREYSNAFRKAHPNVKIHTIGLERRATTMNGSPSTAKKFGVTFLASTISESYSAHADCTPKGAGFSCSIESDGGIFTIVRASPNVRIVTRRIQLEGITKDLDISSKAGKSARSFELKGNKKLTCDEAFD